MRFSCTLFDEKALHLICTLFTGHPVRRVFLCVTVMSIS